MPKPFTFYGDLLGISSYYRLSPKVAYQKLNLYYNTTFRCLRDYCELNRQDIEVQMFSDSLLIWGNDLLAVLPILQQLYIALGDEALLLRGALVEKKLQQDPRLELGNFQKFLPTDETLASAVGLESTEKGARLIIENKLAEQLLEERDEWLTHDGYLNNLNIDNELNGILRKICPTPSNSSFELLYFWKNLDVGDNGYREKVEKLKTISQFLNEPILTHYKETVTLLERCQLRHKLTMQAS